MLGLFRRHANPYPELSRYKVKDVMTHDIVYINTGTSLREAAHVMIGSHVSGLLVFKDSKPAGIMTERDFIKKLDMNQELEAKVLVDDIMTSKLITVDPSTSLFDVHKIMKDNGMRKVVVAQNMIIKGIITQTDLCKVLSKLKTPIVKSPLVSEVMTAKVLSVAPDDKFPAAKKIMASKDTGSVVIVSGDQISGIFTEFDMVSEFFMNPNRLRSSYMRELASSPVFCVSPDVELHFVNKLMLEKGFRRMLVVDNGKLVGILTQTDVARGLYDFILKNKDMKWNAKQPAPEHFVTKKGGIILYSKKA